MAQSESAADEGGSPQSRRVLVARVTGEVGEIIQRWREEHDPEQARRLPPHATLCYWAPDPAQLDALSAQIRHAFATPVTVQLGSVHEFGNRDHTFYVEVLDTAALDAARARLFDSTYLALDGPAEWSWHVTCVRYGVRQPDLGAVREAAAGLQLDRPWVVERVAYLELRGDRYETLHEWDVSAAVGQNETVGGTTVDGE